MSTIDRLEATLSARTPVGLEAAEHAAVAAILRRAEAGTEVLFIERTKREGDPWSGQMAFPGGRVEREDVDPLHTALREAHEEVGLDLSGQARLLGVLDDVRAMARGHLLDLVIRPFVFELLDGAPSFRLQESEVASVLWAPLEEMATGRLDGSFPWTMPGVGSANLPCYHVEGKVVWGLTHRMLRSLFEVLGPLGETK
jgi:8-oxo-dGTP pyrophosphatase MutT (NUDIX family)